MKKSSFTPLMHISIFLTSGIIIARYCSPILSSGYWLLATLFILSVAISLKKHIHYQCYTIYLCIACIGGSITAHEIEQSENSISISDYEDLSSIDKTILYTQSLRNSLEKKMQQV